MEIKERISKARRQIKSKLREYLRVLKIAEKPDRDEYEMSLKITGIGILLIGLVGFAFFMAARLISGV
jgi:protein transport protein SEC61 subunit gamma-like protein